MLAQISDYMPHQKKENLKDIRKLKNDIHNYAVEKKKKIELQQNKVLTKIHELTQLYLDDLSQLITKVDYDLATITTKVESSKQIMELEEVTNLSEKLSQSITQRDVLAVMSRESKAFNKKLNVTVSNLQKFDYKDEILKVNKNIETEFANLDNDTYLSQLLNNLDQESTKLLQYKHKRNENNISSKRRSLIKTQKFTSLNISKVGNGVDIDLFTRQLYDEINIARKNPENFKKLIHEYKGRIQLKEGFAQTQFYSNVVSIDNYLSNLVKSRKSFEALHWDNDLANAAEDLLKENFDSNNLQKIEQRISEILDESYNGLVNYSELRCMVYEGRPSIKKFFLTSLLDSHKSEGLNLLDPNFNVAGISAIPCDQEKMTLILIISKIN